MHVWYFADSTSWYPINSGIQRVTRCLAATFERIGIEVRYLCWNGTSLDFIPLQDPARIAHLQRFNGPQGAQTWAANAIQFAIEGGWLIIPELILPSRKGTLKQMLGRAKSRQLKVATIFYDAIPLKLTEFYESKFRHLYEQYMVEVLSSELIVPISKTSLADLKIFTQARFGMEYNASARLVQLDLPGELAGTKRVTSNVEISASTHTILSVGTVEPRKNHQRLVEAFDKLVKLTHAPVRLVIAGGFHNQEFAKRIGNLISQHESITWIHNCSDEQLSQLYRDCLFTVYPSLEEGYGLPILESLWNGKPCICSRDRAVGEIASGGGCLPVNTHYSDEMTVAMLRLLQDRARLAQLTEEAITRPIKPWNQYATELVGLIALG